MSVELTGVRLLDGKATSQAVRADVAARASVLARRGVRAGLTVVLVGEDPASQVYVKNKDKAASEAGFAVSTRKLPARTRQAELEALVDELNRDRAVHGVLIQLPLPAGLDADALLARLDPSKDVDGLTAANVAALWRGGEGLFPCTPLGCLELLDRHGIEIARKRAVVIGRSQLVGKPLAALFLRRDATVTLCHSRTQDLPAVCREAEILVAAVGRAELVRQDWVRPGAIVLDVGINRTPSGKLVGDVAFDEVSLVAGAITPVPGGIGPMTIALLLQNTLRAAARAAGIPWTELAVSSRPG